MARLPWWGQLLVFLLIAGGVAGAFYYFYEEPAQAQLRIDRAELTRLQARINQGREYSRRLDEFKAQVARDQARLDALKPILPDEKDAGDLLRRIQTLSVQSNLMIRRFQPQNPNTHEMYMEWPISLEFFGTYHDLGAFLDRVSKFPRIINIGGLRVVAKPEASDDPGSITVTCVATTFVLVDTPPAPPDTTKKGAPAKKAPPAAKTE